MNSYVQLTCLVISFLYGILLYFTNKLNEKIFKKKSFIIKIVGFVFYINNMALLYILFLYKINYGILHIYFIMFMLLGYFLISVKKRK